MLRLVSSALLVGATVARLHDATHDQAVLSAHEGLGAREPIATVTAAQRTALLTCPEAKVTRTRDATTGAVTTVPRAASLDGFTQYDGKVSS